MYNYAHESWGPSVTVLGWEQGNLPAGNTTVAYNIMENGSMFRVDGTAGMIMVGCAQDGFFNTYNNDIWNGYNGTTNTLNDNLVGAAALNYDYALAKKWQNIFNCFKHIGDTSNCVAY